jgi:hypothetical protein
VPQENTSEVENQWGFTMRKPKTHVLSPCLAVGEPSQDEWLVYDLDWICAFEIEEDDAVIYLKTTPVDCVGGQAIAAVYETLGAQLWLEGSLTALQNPLYDHGGQHAVDSIEFDYQSVRYRFYHSSFQMGRPCNQEMDCMQTRDMNDTVIEDGCTCDRTLPIVCRSVSPEGTIDDLIDTFEVCPLDIVCGDVN